MEEAMEIGYLENFVLSNPELDRLENLLSEFNVFETLSLTNAEIKHSNFLAWMLDPNENHGLGNYFIKQFLKYIVSTNKSSFLSTNISLFDFELFSYNNVEIRREWNAIDILIIINENNKKVAISIENKIKTLEHSNQLQRYREIVEKEFNQFDHLIFVYLTPENITPSDDTWITFNYEIISELLGELILYKKSILNSNVYYFISQYLTILRRYIVGNSEVEKIAIEIYKKHKQALDLIFQYKPDIYLELSEYIQNKLKEYENIKPDGAGKTFIRFTTKEMDAQVKRLGSEQWTKTKRILLFEFALYGNRIPLRLYIGPGDENYRQKLIEFFLKNKNMFKLADRKFGTKWHAVFQKEFVQAKDFEDEDHEEIKKKIDKKLDEFFNHDLPSIQDYFQANWKD